MKFELGDTVRVIKNYEDRLKIGEIGTLRKYFSTNQVVFKGQNGKDDYFDINNLFPEYFEKVEVKKIEKESESMKFKVGDKVKAIEDNSPWGLKKGDTSILTSDGQEDYLIFKSDNITFKFNKAFEYCFEKINDEYINFEEAIRLIKKGGVELQILKTGSESWEDLTLNMMGHLTIKICLYEKFRIKPKKEKIKRYQVLFYFEKGKYAITENYYKDESDFLENFKSYWFRDKNIMFESLILGSEKEFDD